MIGRYLYFQCFYKNLNVSIINFKNHLQFFLVLQSLLRSLNTCFIFRSELLARLARLPGQIEADDIPDLVTLAQVRILMQYACLTKLSFPCCLLHYQFSYFIDFSIFSLLGVKDQGGRGCNQTFLAAGRKINLMRNIYKKYLLKFLTL